MTKKNEKLQQQIDELAADMLALREKYFPREEKQPPPETDRNPWGA